MKGTWRVLGAARSAIALVWTAAILALFGCGGGAVPAASRADACGTAEANRSTEWRRFRSNYPFHYQTLAVSPAFPDGCRVLVIAEPPPRVTTEQLETQLPLRITRERKRVGHDGYVEDLVTVLPPGMEAATKAQALAVALYGTAHKMYVTGTRDEPPQATALDVRPAPAELAQWLLKDAPDVVPVDGSDAIPLRRVLDAALPGVFFTSRPGLVLWSIPKYRDLESQRVWARQFALESDLVLGSLASRNTLIVVARERQLPPDAFPPLRLESMQLLASVDTAELAQSFERGNFFAGRYDARRDWAPIYLSGPLVDTEYGSLLDIADQFLKSYSQAGGTRYENFAYPDPPTWPFPGPASKFLRAQQLIFNWNTSGLGAIADLGDYRLYWLKQTGSLAVTYIPDGAENPNALNAADRAREYFSSLNNPILARVVQYAALYQMFRDAGITARAKPPAYDADPENDALYNSAVDALKQLDKASAQELAGHIIKDVEAAGSAGDAEAQAMAEADRIRDARSELQRSLAKGLSYSDLARGLVDTRHDLTSLRIKMELGLPLTKEEQSALGSIDFARAMEPLAPAFRTLGGSLDEIKARYEQAAAARASGSIRTPSLIVSENTAGLGGWVGGHNIDSQAPVYRTPAFVPLDTSISRLGSFRIGRSGIERGDPLPVRDLQTALGAVPRSAAERGLSPNLVAAEARPAAAVRQPVSETPGVLKISAGQRTSTGRLEFVVTGPDGTPRRTTSLADVSSAAASELRKSGTALQVHLEGVPPDVALNIAQTLDAQSGSSATIVTLGVPGTEGAEIAPSSARISIEQLRDAQGVLDLTIRLETPSGASRIFARIRSFIGGAGRLTGAARAEVFQSAAMETSKTLGPNRVRVAQYALELKDRLEQLGDATVLAELTDWQRSDIDPPQSETVAGR